MVHLEQDQTSVAPAGGPRRWHEQRWLLDETIRSNGLEWDQPRLGYTLGPVVGEQSASDIAVLRTRIQKVADFVPAVSSVAARHEQLARQAADESHGVTAGEHWHAAAMLWSLAVWPIWETTPELLALDERKNKAYVAWARHASHRVERVDLPCGDKTLPVWFHVPSSYHGRPLPTVVACGGMDAPREIVVAREGDAFLARFRGSRPRWTRTRRVSHSRPLRQRDQLDRRWRDIALLVSFATRGRCRPSGLHGNELWFFLDDADCGDAAGLQGLCRGTPRL